MPWRPSPDPARWTRPRSSTTSRRSRTGWTSRTQIDSAVGEGSFGWGSGCRHPHLVVGPRGRTDAVAQARHAGAGSGEAGGPLQPTAGLRQLAVLQGPEPERGLDLLVAGLE